jgi:two-component system sensor histidine kinase MprB
MSFRRRMVLLAAGAVAAAVVLASVIVYVVTRGELRGQVDASLRQKLTPGQPQAVQVQDEYVTGKTRPAVGAHVNGAPLGSGTLAAGVVAGAPNGDERTLVAPAGARSGVRTEAKGTRPGPRTVVIGRGALLTQSPNALQGPSPTDLAFLSANAAPPAGAKGQTIVRVVLPAQKLGGATGYAQLVQPGVGVLRSDPRSKGLRVTAATLAVAAGKRPAFFADATVAGTAVRVLTERALPGGGVWQVALPLTEVNSTLARLELVLALVSLGGVALAALLGLLVSRAALVPVRHLTDAAERVAHTQDLGHRIAAGGEDELGRLAGTFNTMLEALERSRLAQRQLVSDASHELRTPLTSVRANLDALAMGDLLSPTERDRAVAAAGAQLAELTVLVGDLVDLSKTEVDEIEVEDVCLDLAAAHAVERARLHAPECRFVLDAEPCLVRAAPARLDRAIANLLDNAVKWGPPAGPVEVYVRSGRLDVRDHGPGIAAADLPRVFDRFYRSSAARGLPGSGLGLAIVRQVAETHGGAVRAANDRGGGARLTLELPALALTAAETAAFARAAPSA